MDILFTVLSYWDSALAVILVLSGLIFVHELGHFLANRALGVGVITFSLGMGPRLWGFTRGKTEYRMSWFPFGGFVAAVGEYDDRVEEIGFTQNEAINQRPAWHRLCMAFAGPLANLLTAWLLYWGITFTSGLAIPLPEVGAVMPDSAAAEAGLLPGDIILAVDGREVDNWNMIPLYVGDSAGKELRLDVRRNRETFTTHLTPRRMTRTNIFGEEENAWLIGIRTSGAVRHEERGFLAAGISGLEQTWNIMILTLTGLKKLVTGAVPSDSVGGPILIAQMLGEQAKMGLVPLLLLTALISVNLGLLNLLPIPVLDGGLILVSAIEMLIRKRIQEKVLERSMQAGAALLITLMVFATFNDIMRWIR